MPEPGNTAAFAGAVRRLLRDDALREQFSETAKRRAVENFDISGAVREIGQALEQARLNAKNRNVSGAA